ncbi:MAG: nicotinate-nucleotide--dimethylbenzimidazole phosphoribosyltransferase, partial [Oscillospiraceae bacterium]|nr:nicotinate-nucleotide--dimethylbenzimidazole phosphoribosyltransferase [Oscillospiraceae bacterium]
MERIQSITPPDAAAMQAAKAHWDSIAKPLGSFGLFEEMVTKIAGIQGTASPDISCRTAVILCADHGVTAQGVTQCGSEVTAVCAAAIAEGRSNVNSLAAAYGAEVIAVDMGMVQEIDCPMLLKRRIAAGTADFSTEPAMTAAQAVQCIRTGIDLACMAKAQGARILLTGEMGIGNTTAASAIAAVLLSKPPEEVTGRGAGLSDAGLRRKTEVIRRSLALHKPSPDDPVGLLSAVGGFEIAGMTGLFL